MQNASTDPSENNGEPSVSRGLEASSLFSISDLVDLDDRASVYNEMLFMDGDEYGKAPAFSVSDMLLQRYEVKDLLHGGQGQIYRCLDHRLGIPVALKTVIPKNMGDRTALQLFFQEAERCLRLRPHDNVVRIYRVEIINSYPYIVSEWIEGDPQFGNSLDAWIAKGYPFTAGTVLDFLQQACDGLMHCGRLLSKDGSPFVHGDIKPANIMVTKNHLFKICDFGVGAMTRGFSPPKRARHGPSDEWTDVYGLGKTASLMLGKPESDDGGRLHARLLALVNQCMDPKYGTHPPSVGALRAMLGGLCPENPSANSREKDMRPTMMEQADQIYSEIELGSYTGSSVSDRITNIATTRLNINDYILFVSTEDHYFYEGELAYRRGELENALKHYKLATTKGKYSSRVLTAIGRTLQAMGDKVGAWNNFTRAVMLDHHYPAMECAAELCLLNGWSDSPDRFLRKAKDYLLGRLSSGRRERGLFMLLGKYSQLLREYGDASDYYRECLRYPSPAEWLDIYRYGQCEYSMHNLTKADAIFRVAARTITDDPLHQENMLKLSTLLNCYYYVWEDQSVTAVISVIKDKYPNFRDQYAGLEQSIHKDREEARHIMDSVSSIMLTHADKEAAAREIAGLFSRVSDPLSGNSPRLVSDMAKVLGSREVSLYVEAGEYAEGIRACDKSLEYDHCAPGLLQNKGACFMLMGDCKNALLCYNLAIRHELDSGRRSSLIRIRDDIFESIGKPQPHTD